MKQNASKCILIKEHNDQGGMARVLGDNALAPIKFTFLYLNQQMAQGREQKQILYGAKYTRSAKKIVSPPLGVP